MLKHGQCPISGFAFCKKRKKKSQKKQNKKNDFDHQIKPLGRAFADNFGPRLGEGWGSILNEPILKVKKAMVVGEGEMLKLWIDTSYRWYMLVTYSFDYKYEYLQQNQVLWEKIQEDAMPTGCLLQCFSVDSHVVARTKNSRPENEK